MHLILVTLAVIFITTAIVAAVFRPKAALPRPADPPGSSIPQKSPLTPTHRQTSAVIDRKSATAPVHP